MAGKPRHTPSGYIYKKTIPLPSINIFQMENDKWYYWWSWHPVKLNSGKWSLFEIISRMKIREGHMFYSST